MTAGRRSFDSLDDDHFDGVSIEIVDSRAGLAAMVFRAAVMTGRALMAPAMVTASSVPTAVV